MRFQVHYACASHIGNVRKINQDNWICNGVHADADAPAVTTALCGIVDLKKPTLFGVFDGMGGEECGEVASYLAAKCAASFPLRKNGVRALAAFCEQANAAICAYARTHDVFSMGTTAALLLCSKKEITLCNIGDSKVFRYTNGTLEQLSQDHVSFAPFGVKPPLSQYLGIPPEELQIAPYISELPCRGGDGYLLCSDGLTDMLTAEDIREVFEEFPVSQAADVLIDRALCRGGKDNITVLLLEVRPLTSI